MAISHKYKKKRRTSWRLQLSLAPQKGQVMGQTLHLSLYTLYLEPKDPTFLHVSLPFLYVSFFPFSIFLNHKKK